MHTNRNIVVDQQACLASEQSRSCIQIGTSLPANRSVWHQNRTALVDVRFDGPVHRPVRIVGSQTGRPGQSDITIFVDVLGQLAL